VSILQVVAPLELEQLHHFKKLESLYLPVIRSVQDLLPMLAAYSSQLKALHICQAFCTIDFRSIVLRCPKLETLEIAQSALLLFGLAAGPLVTALQTIEIDNTMMTQYEITNLTLKFSV
jgi:ABC-type arginine transport system permease subunit